MASSAAAPKPAKPTTPTYRRRGAKRAALALVPPPPPSTEADPTPSETAQESAEAPQPTPIPAGAAPQTLSLAEPHWQQHLHDEDYWRQRLDRAQKGMEQLVGRATKAKIGLPVAKQVEIRETATENAIRALWSALQIEGRITQAEIEARISEVMLRYYEPVIEQLLRTHDEDILLHGHDALAFGGNGGSALSDARSRAATARPRVPRVGFKKAEATDGSPE